MVEKKRQNDDLLKTILKWTAGIVAALLTSGIIWLISVIVTVPSLDMRISDLEDQTKKQWERLSR